MYPVGIQAAVEVKVNLKLKSAWSPQGSTAERSFAEQIKDQDNSLGEILMNQTVSGVPSRKGESIGRTVYG